MNLWQLFIAFLEAGAFAFGGGYAALPLIEEVVIKRYQWLSLSEMTDIIALSQITPGPIALNVATFVGTRVAGIPGAIIASFAAVLPQTAFLLFLGWFIFHGGRMTVLDRALKSLRPGVSGLIGSAAFSMLVSSLTTSTQPLNVDWLAFCAFGIVFLLRLRQVGMKTLIVIGVGVGLLGGLVEGFFS